VPWESANGGQNTGFARLASPYYYSRAPSLFSWFTNSLSGWFELPGIRGDECFAVLDRAVRGHQFPGTPYSFVGRLLLSQTPGEVHVACSLRRGIHVARRLESGEMKVKGTRRSTLLLPRFAGCPGCHGQARLARAIRRPTPMGKTRVSGRLPVPPGGSTGGPHPKVGPSKIAPGDCMRPGRRGRRPLRALRQLCHILQPGREEGCVVGGSVSP
jgi:hypothetical protein